MAKKKEIKIKKSMTFGELMEKHPEASEVLLSKGMHCFGCPMSMQETIAEGAMTHGINPAKLIKEINEKLN